MKKINRILIALLWLLVVAIVIKSTPPSEALVFDARNYYSQAIEKVSGGSLLSSWVDISSGEFIDYGYVFVLGLIIKIFGHENIVIMQIFNYLFWLLASFFIYKTLKFNKIKNSIKWATLALFSPLYLTFSSKLYSEPFAAMGLSIAIYGITRFHKEKDFTGLLSTTLGGFIFFSTKSVFLLLVVPVLAIFAYKKLWKIFLAILLIPILLLPTIISSSKGGRMLYNLNIQSAKVAQRPSTIAACGLYFLSYPVGVNMLPSYQGACHQNDPKSSMPMVDENPYLQAAQSRNSEEGFKTIDWINRVASSPVKYIAVMLSSMASIFLFEGIYPSILLEFPEWLIYPTYIVTKVSLSFLLWFYAIKTLKNSYKSRKLKFILLSLPLIYFFFVVGNFPVEQRYFYPLVPYMYLLAGYSKIS